MKYKVILGVVGNSSSTQVNKFVVVLWLD